MKKSVFATTCRGRSKVPSEVAEAIEATGRVVTMSDEMLRLIPDAYADDGSKLTVVRPCDFGFDVGGSLRAIHHAALNKYGLLHVPAISAMAAARDYRDQPAGEDIVIATEFIRGPDGKPYVFSLSNNVWPGILQGGLDGPTFGAIYFHLPTEFKAEADFVAADQKIMYLLR